jgi:hypothetical protein
MPTIEVYFPDIRKSENEITNGKNGAWANVDVTASPSLGDFFRPMRVSISSSSISELSLISRVDSDLNPLE